MRSLELAVLHPFREAARALRSAPWYSAVALLSIGLAVGMASATFSVVSDTHLRPLPYSDPASIVQIFQTRSPSDLQRSDYLQPSRLEAWVADAPFRSLESIAGASLGPTLVVRGVESNRRVEGSAVVGDWFGTLGLAAERGRLIGQADLEPGAPPVAVVSRAFWKDDLQSADGAEVELSGVRYVVVGVLPESASHGRKVWVPRWTLAEGVAPAAYAGVARVRQGLTTAQADTEIRRQASLEVQEDSARFAGRGATAVPIAEIARGGMGQGMWMLVGVVGSVLLLAMNNLIVLALARAQERVVSFAVRTALGADQASLTLVVAAEATLLGVAAAAFSMGFAFVGKETAARLAGTGEIAAGIGWQTVAFSVALSLLSAFAVGAGAVKRARSLDLHSALKRRSGGATTTVGERRVRAVLVGAQVGMGVVLLTIAGVMSVAYVRFADLEMGIETRAIIEAQPDWAVAESLPHEQWTIAEAVASRLSREPALVASGWRQIGMDFPPRPENAAVTDGPEVDLGTFDGLYRYYEVLPDFFDVLGMEVVDGVSFSERSESPEPIAVVTRRASELWWPNERAVGRQIRLGEEGAWMTVVGVVEDVQQLDELGRTSAMRGNPIMPLLFMPHGQFSEPPTGWREFECCSGVRIGARTLDDGTSAQASILRVLADVAPALPITRVGSLHEVQMAGYYGRRISSSRLLVNAGGIVALLLVILGIVGMVGEAVVRRSKEVGIRIALGAGPRDVVFSVTGQSVLTTCVGVVSGLAVLWIARDAIGRLFFINAVTRLAPDLLSAEVLSVSGGLVIVAALLSLTLAGRKAFQIDPIDVLRSE